MAHRWNCFKQEHVAFSRDSKVSSVDIFGFFSICTLDGEVVRR